MNQRTLKSKSIMLSLLIIAVALLIAGIGFLVPATAFKAATVTNSVKVSFVNPDGTSISEQVIESGSKAVVPYQELDFFDNNYGIGYGAYGVDQSNPLQQQYYWNDLPTTGWAFASSNIAVSDGFDISSSYFQSLPNGTTSFNRAYSFGLTLNPNNLVAGSAKLSSIFYNAYLNNGTLTINRNGVQEFSTSVAFNDTIFIKYRYIDDCYNLFFYKNQNLIFTFQNVESALYPAININGSGSSPSPCIVNAGYPNFKLNQDFLIFNNEWSNDWFLKPYNSINADATFTATFIESSSLLFHSTMITKSYSSVTRDFTGLNLNFSKISISVSNLLPTRFNFYDNLNNKLRIEFSTGTLGFVTLRFYYAFQNESLFQVNNLGQTWVTHVVETKIIAGSKFEIHMNETTILVINANNVVDTFFDIKQLELRQQRFLVYNVIKMDGSSEPLFSGNNYSSFIRVDFFRTHFLKVIFVSEEYIFAIHFIKPGSYIAKIIEELPRKVGYRFFGWLGNNGESAYSTLYDDTTFTAQYEQVGDVAVIWLDFYFEPLRAITVPYDENIDHITAPEIDGTKFMYWRKIDYDFEYYGFETIVYLPIYSVDITLEYYKLERYTVNTRYTYDMITWKRVTRPVEYGTYIDLYAFDKVVYAINGATAFWETVQGFKFLGWTAGINEPQFAAATYTARYEFPQVTYNYYSSNGVKFETRTGDVTFTPITEFKSNQGWASNFVEFMRNLFMNGFGGAVNQVEAQNNAQRMYDYLSTLYTSDNQIFVLTVNPDIVTEAHGGIFGSASVKITGSFFERLQGTEAANDFIYFLNTDNIYMKNISWTVSLTYGTPLDKAIDVVAGFFDNLANILIVAAVCITVVIVISSIVNNKNKSKKNNYNSNNNGYHGKSRRPYRGRKFNKGRKHWR